MPIVSILKPHVLYVSNKKQTTQRKALVMALGTGLIITIILVWIATSSIE